MVRKVHEILDSVHAVDLRDVEPDEAAVAAEEHGVDEDAVLPLSLIHI